MFYTSFYNAWINFPIERFLINLNTKNKGDEKSGITTDVRFLL